MEEQKKKKKILLITGGVIALIVLISAIFMIIESRKSATLEIMVAPISAKVSIDGKVYKNGTYKFEPGRVEVTITMDGFDSKEETLDLQANVTTKLYTYLMPSDGTFGWYLEHEEDQMILNTIGDTEASENSKTYVEKYPIITALPIIYANYDEKWNYTEFRIDGGGFDDCEKSFCIKITDSTGGNYERALGLIKEKGFNPEDYEIIYKEELVKPLE